MSELSLNSVKNEIAKVSKPERAKLSQRYFKTGPGEYGEGDVFVGVTMPNQRLIAKKHLGLGLSEVQKLLDSVVHEERMIGLLILTYQYPKASPEQQSSIYSFYLKNTKRINNWDLVDSSAPYIVGEYLMNKNRRVLTSLAKSKLLWDRRIAILATAAFIKKGEYEWTFKIAEILLTDQHDLIHKAVGWMLREVGKSCGESVEKMFLDKHAKTMPRTMLRYALEKLNPEERKKYLSA